jgi:chaperone required for assembly of F1-ATPase
MKRFYKAARAAAFGAIEIDGKPAKTPGRQPLVLPNQKLAEAVAEEWNTQSEEIDLRTMPLTGLANAAIDRIAPDEEVFARGLAIYGESDLLCYRAESPPLLVERQAKAWDPILQWARRHYDVDFEVASGIMHRHQPQATVDRLGHAVHIRSAFELAGLSPLVTISGSLVVALALAEGAIDVDTAWKAATVDEKWQTDHWGEDDEAARTLAARQRDFEAGRRFLSLL